MAKVQVYLPDALHARVKARLRNLNVSAVLQDALEEKLAELERKKALDLAIGGYERAHGKITDAEVDAALAKMQRAARRPHAKRTATGRAKRRAA